jgi:O-antigen/teichoic acid export membrane protein
VTSAVRLLDSSNRPNTLPPVLSRMMRGTFFLALKTPLQALIALISIPLVQSYVGDGLNGAYVFAWGFGFIQFLLEFGMSSALQRQVADTWTRGDRQGVEGAIACGMNFYAGIALFQGATLLVIAYFVLPWMSRFSPDEAALIVKLLWLQALTSPFFGLSAVVSSVLQAARRFDFMPRIDMGIVVLRFGVLLLGLRAGVDFFWIVVAQTALQVVFSLGPGLWVMVRELGYTPRFSGARWADFATLTRISGYMFMLQLSVVLADKIDTTVLGFALPKGDVGPAITVYQNVSKPFSVIRQTGWTLAYYVMPAVASLAAAGDLKGLDRVKYDGPRFLVGLLLPVALLAGIYAGPFLNLWVGERFEKDAPMLQLFLVALLPLVLAIQAQMAIGIGHIKLMAVVALVGSLVNLPLSFFLTRQPSIGVAGVIWGTVLTTLISNLIIPGIHLFKVLEVDVRAFLTRTLSAPLAGAACLVAATWAFGRFVPASPGPGVGWWRAGPFAANLAVGVLAYLAGYIATHAGRTDFAALWAKVRRRTAPS